MTESHFTYCFSRLGNGAFRIIEGKRVEIYTLSRIANNQFGLSYHLYLHQKKLRYNFWYNKINGTVRVSLWDGSISDHRLALNNVFETGDFAEFQEKINEIIESI